MTEMNARIVLWGIAGSGKTTTLQTIHDKLRSDLRGEMRFEPTRLDPTIHSEALPISLGDVGGVGTQIEIVAVPGADDLAMTRKQLLDEVDGIILVLDCSKERIADNASAIAELHESLASYGRSLETIPVVLQYNKRDIADPFAIEQLHREIGLEQAAVFETIATTGHGILATLTTISKHVVRKRRTTGEAEVAAPEPTTETTPELTPEPLPEFDTPPELQSAETEPVELSSHEILEAAILAEGEEDAFEGLVEGERLDFTDSLDFSEDPNADSFAAKPKASLGADLRIVSVGQASVDAEGAIQLPLVLGDDEGESRSVVLSLRLDGLDTEGD